MNKTLAALILSSCVLRAQDGAEKISVPLDDPSRPVRVHAQLLSGGIAVRGADVKNVTVEVNSEGSRRSHQHRSAPPKADGMKRLELPGNSGLEIVEQDNLVTINKTPWSGTSNLVITVPRRTSLQLKCLNDGDIRVDGVEGEIDVNDLNGSITLRDVSGSVLAHSLNGEVSATLDRIDGSKPMSFSTLNGDIDVTLPASLRANILIKTDHGEIYSDYEVKLNSPPAKSNDSGRQPDGTYRLRIDRALRGTIAGGGPDFQFTSFNGQIYLRKKK